MAWLQGSSAAVALAMTPRCDASTNQNQSHSTHFSLLKGDCIIDSYVGGIELGGDRLGLGATTGMSVERQLEATGHSGNTDMFVLKELCHFVRSCSA